MAVATIDGQEETRAPRAAATRLAAIGVAAVCVAGAVYLGLEADDAARLQHADDLGAAGRFAAAAAEARGVSRQPAKARAQLVEAYALVELGDDRRASAAFERAAAADPSNWVIRRDWASTLARLGQRRAALAQLARAAALNPLMPLPPEFEPSARVAR